MVTLAVILGAGFIGYQAGYLRGDASGYKTARRLFKSDADFWHGEYRAIKAGLMLAVSRKVRK